MICPSKRILRLSTKYLQVHPRKLWTICDINFNVVVLKGEEAGLCHERKFMQMRESVFRPKRSLGIGAARSDLRNILD